MKKLLIHIGMGKSASTTIQRSILSHPTAPKSIGRHSSSPNNGTPDFWWRGLISPKQDALNLAKTVLLDQYFQFNDTVIISDEVFSSSVNFLENLYKNLKDFPVEVVILWVTRDPADFLESLYNHSMRSRVYAFGVPRLNSELINRFTYKGDIDCWCKDLMESYRLGDVNQLNVLHYSTWGNRFMTVIGTNNFITIPFELLKKDSWKFSTELAKLFDMAPQDVHFLLEDKKNVTGERLRDYLGGGFLMKLMNLKIFRFLKYLGFSRDDITKFIVKFVGKVLPRNKQYLSQEIRREIDSIYHNK